MSGRIYIKKSGTMGMGTGSDTRMYAPRSESSHMYRANNEDESTYTGAEDPRYRDQIADKKKKERKKRANEMKRLKHLSIKPSDLESIDNEDEEEKFNSRAGVKEPSIQTGSSGNFGALTSLAMQARGPGFAGGEGVEGYKFSSEPMDIAFQLLKSPVMPGRAGFPEDEQETIDLEHHMFCEDCKGSGMEPDPDFPGEECTTCDGAGTLAGIRANIPAYADRQGMRAGGQQYFTKSKKKSKKKDKKTKKEERKKWRPSTGMFKKPPGGFDISTATPRRAKARMRGIKGGKRTGLGRAHLAVEMGHRTVGKNKQPTSKDIGRYRQYLGQQEAQRRLGNIRSPTSIPQRFGARSYRAGPTGGGALRQLAGQAALARRPAIRRPSRPRMMPSRGVRRPTMPRAPSMPVTPSPQYRSGYARQSMVGGAQYAPSRMPSASMQGGPSMVMTGEIGEGSDLQKKRFTYYDKAELRQLINEARMALKRKDKKNKGKGDANVGVASNLPNHNNAPTKETTRPEGATEDANNDPRTFGVNPLDHLTSRGGRTP